MKKKFTLEIISPCSENFDKMISDTSGSFCNSCAKNVIDLSRKTNSEVAKFIAENKDKNICARLKRTQLNEEFEYSEFSKINSLKYAAVAASILITSNIVGQEKTPVKTEVNATKKDNYIVEKVAYNQNNNEEVSIIVKGNLLETKTNKPLDTKTYRNLIITINGTPSTLKIDPETGAFSIPIQVLKNSKTFVVKVMADDYYFSKIVPFAFESVKDNILVQNISLTAEELSKVEGMILGGLGINYSNVKTTKEI